MSWNIIFRNAARVAVIVPLLAITPLTLQPTEGIQENRACASGGCLERIGEICYVDGVVIRDHINTPRID